MSISAEPLKEPPLAICIRRESMVASTKPSTTSVSQSVISTPLSLMLGPTVSLAGDSWVLVSAAAATLEGRLDKVDALTRDEDREEAEVEAEPAAGAVDAEELEVVEVLALLSRLPKKDSERSMVSPEISNKLKQNGALPALR